LRIVLGIQKKFDKMDDLYWANASVDEKIETITFLMGCFYGKEATTGRLPNILSNF